MFSTEWVSLMLIMNLEKKLKRAHYCQNPKKKSYNEEHDSFFK